MQRKHALRMLQLKIIVAELEKLAQQLRLPGVQEPQLDLPGVSLQQPSKEDRHDLSSVDLSSLTNEYLPAIKDIIHYELKSNPTLPKQEIIDAVLTRVQNDERWLPDLIKEYLPKIPSLKARLPGEARQMTLPGTPPEINIFPTKENIDTTKLYLQRDVEKMQEEKQKKIEEYDAKKKLVIEKYKAEHNGEEPSDWDLRRLMDYENDPRNDPYSYGGGYGRVTKPEEVRLDTELETLTQAEYTTYLNKLYAVYYEIENNYNSLNALYAQMEDIKDPEEIPPADPAQFDSYEEMMADMQKRIVAGIKSIVKNSLGYSLFGTPTGKGRRRWRNENDIFSEKDEKWFENPEEMKAFLEEIPKAYDHKDRFFSHWGRSANDLQYWFDRKYEAMTSYNDSLKRAKTSFGKGLRFYKSVDKKINEEIKKAAQNPAFKLKSYIETTPEHREKLNALYLEIVKRINDSSQTLGRSGYYYNNGLYQESNYGGGRIDQFDLGALLSSKTPQYTIIYSLAELLHASIKKVADQVKDNELGPFVRALSEELANNYLKEKLNLAPEDIPAEKSQYDYTVDYADPRCIKVADAWLQYATASKLSINFQSLIKYPEFIFKGEQDNTKFLIEAMKERLGYEVSKLLTGKLYKVCLAKITDVVNDPSFSYKGSNELRKLITAQKELVYTNIQKGLEESVSQGSIDLMIGRDVSWAENPVMPRYEKLKGLVKAAIGRVEPGSNYFTQLAYKMPYQSYGHAKTVEELNPEIIANKLIEEKLAGRRDYYGNTSYLDSFLKHDALAPLEKSIKARKEAITSKYLVPGPTESESITRAFRVFDHFVPVEVQNRFQGLYPKDINTKEEVEKLHRELTLPTTFDNISIEGMSESDIQEQQKLNAEYNERLQMAIQQINYVLDIQKKMTMENVISNLFTSRLAVFGGVGPHAIGAKFQELTKTEEYQHLPLAEMAKLANDGVMKNIKENDFQEDYTIDLYRQFNNDGMKGTTLAAAIRIIAKTLQIKDPHQLIKLKESLGQTLREKNISREDVEMIFPVLITNLDALQSQLEAAETLAEFAHSEGEGLSKEQILAFAKNPNFKDWVKEVDAIENFFDIYITIIRKGGPKKIVEKEKAAIDALTKTKAIRKGFQRRLQLIVQAFEKGTRINPSIEGFESIRKLINQTKYDLDAVESFATFAEYNAEIEEKKLFKDPQLFKLNWNMPDKKFRFRVLETFDPYHFQVGVDTDCCQKLGGAGESAAIDSYINPLAGVVLLEANIDGVYKTVAQSYFHYVPTDNGIILDNVETSDYEDELEKVTGYDIEHLYAWWASFKKAQRKYKYFLCGTGYNKLDEESFGDHSMRKDPRSFQYVRPGYSQPYSDWRPNNSLDLFAPRFEMPEEMQIKKKKREKRLEALFNLFPLLAFG